MGAPPGDMWVGRRSRISRRARDGGFELRLSEGAPLMRATGLMDTLRVCSPHEPRDAPISAFTRVCNALWARPPAICGDPRRSRISRRARERGFEPRLSERRAAHAGYARRRFIASEPAHFRRSARFKSSVARTAICGTAALSPHIAGGARLIGASRGSCGLRQFMIDGEIRGRRWSPDVE